MKLRSLIGIIVGASVFLCAPGSFAAPAATSAAPNHTLDPMVLIALAAILVFAKLGGELFERIDQPAVLGELIVGIVMGNLVLAGFD